MIGEFDDSYRDLSRDQVQALTAGAEIVRLIHATTEPYLPKPLEEFDDLDALQGVFKIGSHRKYLADGHYCLEIDVHGCFAAGQPPRPLHEAYAQDHVLAADPCYVPQALGSYAALPVLYRGGLLSSDLNTPAAFREITVWEVAMAGPLDGGAVILREDKDLVGAHVPLSETERATRLTHLRDTHPNLSEEDIAILERQVGECRAVWKEGLRSRRDLVVYDAAQIEDLATLIVNIELHGQSRDL